MNTSDKGCPFPVADGETGLQVLKGLARTRSLLTALTIMQDKVGNVFQVNLPGFRPAVMAGAGGEPADHGQRAAALQLAQPGRSRDALAAPGGAGGRRRAARRAAQLDEPAPAKAERPAAHRADVAQHGPDYGSLERRRPARYAGGDAAHRPADPGGQPVLDRLHERHGAHVAAGDAPAGVHLAGLMDPVAGYAAPQVPRRHSRDGRFPLPDDPHPARAKRQPGVCSRWRPARST